MGITGDNKNEEQVLRKILEGTASHTGEIFFQALVKTLAKTLNTKGAWVTEYLPDKNRLRAISFWMDDHFVDEYEYDINGTPCENVIGKSRLFHVPENVIELFPEDPDLEPFDAVSYLGAPLLDLDGSILGHLAVQDTRPMPQKPNNVALFKIFADRAASELRRIRSEKQIQEREEQLTRLFESAMDAIIEIDAGLKVTQVNPAAAKLFGCDKKNHLLNHSLEKYMTVASYRKLTNILKELQKRPEGRRYLWVPGGFDACNAKGDKLQTEATISCYCHNRKTYYNLVLRNVSERIEAEKRIDILAARNQYLQQEIRELHHADEIIGESEAICKVSDQIAQVAETDATVLITGETGTGKELIARAIHSNSLRNEGPMVKVNCAAIPSTLIESEFFGHQQGAFTGATEKRKGRFELADDGTIFLDEIGELPLDMQSKLLRVLQEGEFEPVGSSKTQKVNVRVVAATNRNLQDMVSEGTFREDLYYRLNVFPILVPPLRERDNDVVLIAESFIHEFSQQTGRKVQPLTEVDIHLLKSYHWPGNIRELRNIIERAVITSQNGYLHLSDLINTSSGAIHQPSKTSIPGKIFTGNELQQLERQNMVRALEKTDWKVSGKNGAAALLGIPPTTFSSRMKALKIKRP